MKSCLFLFFFFLFGLKTLWGQEIELTKKNESDSSGVVNSSLLPLVAPLLLFDEEKEKEERKTKKKNLRKNTWYGVKTTKGSTRRSLRGQEYLELFSYTDLDRKINPYIRDVYWYDPKEKSIQAKGFEKGMGYLLHGPYQRTVNGVVVESGMFYFGTKHKTWMIFDGQGILQDKEHFQEGWPKESKISYFNPSTGAIEKITPVQYGLEEGNFYHFHENRQLAVTGEYKYGQKVGLWTEYWDTSSSPLIRKREIQYQEKPYTDNFKSYIKAEWSKEGKLLYQKVQ